MPWYDLHVEIQKKEEALEMAKRLNYSGIAIVNKKDDEVVDGIELISSALIEANNKEELKAKLQSVRSKVTLVLVSGGKYEVNRSACEDSRVDVLCHPYLGRADPGIDHICARAARENNVALEINFSTILNSPNRPKTLSQIRKMVEICEKYEAPIVITSGAKNPWEMRAARDLAALAATLGVDIAYAIRSLSVYAKNLIEVNRQKLQGSRVGDALIVREGDEGGG